MKNFIGTVEAKHGKFNFCHFDEFIGLSLREYGEYSELELSTIQNFIKKGDVVFDIGANIGAFSVPLAKKVGSTGKVYSFEPQPYIAGLLNQNIKSNKLRNVKILRKALGFKKQTLKLDDIDYSKVGNFGGVGLVLNNSGFTKLKSKKKHNISVTKLDKFLYVNSCNFIKIDVEFMELDVLRGGEKFLKKFRPIVWVENHKTYPNDVNNFLLKNDYTPYWAVTMLFNPDNYFVNDVNYYNNAATINTLAVPKEKRNFCVNSNLFNEIIDANTPPINAVTKLN